MIHTAVSSANAHWVASICQQPFGSGSTNRMTLARGRFCGCGGTSPLRTSTRWIVDTRSGRRDRGANPCGPSARYRQRSR